MFCLDLILIRIWTRRGRFFVSTWVEDEFIFPRREKQRWWKRACFTWMPMNSFQSLSERRYNFVAITCISLIREPVIFTTPKLQKLLSSSPLLGLASSSTRSKWLPSSLATCVCLSYLFIFFFLSLFFSLFEERIFGR